MKGYKVLLSGLVNRYGTVYELNKKYILRGELKSRENGFHFCSRPEDTLRYIDAFNEEFDMVEVEGSGDLHLYEDDYYEYFDMYASSEMEIKRVIPREEWIRSVIDSKIPDRVKRLISTMKLTDDEIELIREKYNTSMDFYIDYYQNKDKELKRS